MIFSLAFNPGFYEEIRRNIVYEKTKASCKVKSYTSRRQAFAEDDTNAVVLNISGNPETKVSLTLDKPIKMQVIKFLKELVDVNEVFWTGHYPSESIRMHRVVFSNHFKTEFTITDKESTGDVDWYYVRIKQANGQLAWSSPIWVGNI